MITAFILKLRKFRSKTDKENFDTKRTLEDGASNVRSSKLLDDTKSEQNGAGAKRYGDSFEHFYRKYRKLAKPKFLSGRWCRSKKKMKWRKDYSNTKVKTKNLLTNVFYRRFKQSDFNKSGFIIDILPFLLQNFNPINLDRKLDTEKECDMVKFLWDECIPHEF